jgi:hypothetical protein
MRHRLLIVREEGVVRIIPVEPYPLQDTYATFEGAIAGALRHPLQALAQADTAAFFGASVADAWWTDTDYVVQFSNGRLLHIWADGEVARWTVTHTAPTLDAAMERIGAPAVLCRWPPVLGDRVWDRSALAAKRVGSEFVRLFVTGGAMLVYCRGQLIWWFSAVRRTDLGVSILHVCEEE